MTMSRGTRHLLLLVVGLLVVACALTAWLVWSPGARKARHLERGDRHVARAQYREAVIEYRNVLQIDAGHPHAIRQLGLAHYQLGELEPAARYLGQTQRIAPNDVDVRLRLATIYLLTRQADRAREQAASVLDRDPKSLEALALLAGAANTPAHIDAALDRLEAARADLGGKAKLHLAFGTLYVRRGDLSAAERAFREAVAVEPKSLDARLALGELHVLRRDLAQAEREFKAAADLVPVGAPAWMTLADFYLRARKPQEAKRLLADVTEQVPNHPQAWGRLAELAFSEGKYDDSLRAVEVVLRNNPSSIEGQYLRGRVYLAQRRAAEAVQDLERVLKFEPRFAPAHYQIALAELRIGNHQQARWRLRQALAIDPSFTEAALRLAELDIQAGAVQPAIETLDALIAKHPREVHAYVLLASAWLARGEPVKATDTARKIGPLAPSDPRGPFLAGMGLVAQGNRAEATQQFEAALALAPWFVDPLSHLVALALSEKRADAALERVKRQIASVPTSGRLHGVLGAVHVARGETRLAEAAFLRALELEPTLISGYLALAQLYAKTGKYDEALAKLHEGLRADPQNPVALVRAGMLYESKGDFVRGQQSYEQALAFAPRFVPAANNLAYLYSERGGDKEKALQLARIAKEDAPDDPHVSDTLGWILYRRGIYPRALSLLRESAAKLPENPEVNYHLGMAAHKSGDLETARKALTKAIAAPLRFTGKDEAAQVLSTLR
ncbi:MAG: hypothetical protein DME04_03835 [Candidatus Rokuibacteriota bacterium]|nr:MAG: hypothetical protein DME04_03835 [Candidatus Rokubacteria bacterium]